MLMENVGNVCTLYISVYGQCGREHLEFDRIRLVTQYVVFKQQGMQEQRPPAATMNGEYQDLVGSAIPVA